MAAMTNEQLETGILYEVVTRFMDRKESTSRRALLIKFEGHAAWHAIGNLLTRNCLRRQTLTNPSTDAERYLPNASAFQFCGDSRFRDEAKAATTDVFHAVKAMYKREQKKDGFALEDLKSELEEKYPTRKFDPSALALGLYLAKDFGVLGSYRLNPPDDTEVTSFQVGDSAISMPNAEAEWDAVMARHKPSEVVFGLEEAEAQSDFHSLPNKEALLIHLVTAIGGKQLVSVAFVDLDNFKQVNDEHGHLEGDRCIVTVVECISAAISRKGRLYRVGGDEFCILLPNFSIMESAATAERVRAAVDALEPFNGTTKVTTSIGVAASDSDSERFASDPESLLRAADEAMYVSKRVTKNRVTTWPPSEADRKLAQENMERAKKDGAR
jgi:diguanylate cyclase (GGDEF)-like protein